VADVHNKRLEVRFRGQTRPASNGSAMSANSLREHCRSACPLAHEPPFGLPSFTPSRFRGGHCSTGPLRNGREEYYLIVACTVITDVPEAVGACPVASMEKVSLPLYLAFALYS
jgi:hypothetical protein